MIIIVAIVIVALSGIAFVGVPAITGRPITALFAQQGVAGAWEYETFDSGKVKFSEVAPTGNEKQIDWAIAGDMRGYTTMGDEVSLMCNSAVIDPTLIAGDVLTVFNLKEDNPVLRILVSEIHSDNESEAQGEGVILSGGDLTIEGYIVDENNQLINGGEGAVSIDPFAAFYMGMYFDVSDDGTVKLSYGGVPTAIGDGTWEENEDGTYTFSFGTAGSSGYKVELAEDGEHLLCKATDRTDNMTLVFKRYTGKDEDRTKSPMASTGSFSITTGN